MKYDFHQQNNKNFVKEAEEKCFKFLTEAGMDVRNVANDQRYFKYGIDLIVKEPNNIIYIDVKADTKIHETGNIFYELIECFWKDRKDIKQGWGLNKYLHYIYYVDVKNWILYIILLKELRNFIYNNSNFQCRLIPHLNHNYKTIGFLIPLIDIKNIITTVNL